MKSQGALRVHPANPGYFTDDSGRALLLAGSHTWTVLQDAGRTWPPPAFDFDAWLAWLERKGHSCFRMWTWEQARWVAHDPGDFYFDPLPYQRTGPREALDGRPRFDLSRFDERYFDRLHARVRASTLRGIHPIVMLFQGWSVEWKQFGLSPGRNPWPGHPFHPANNVNEIDGDPTATDEGLLAHSLALPEVNEIQRAYLRRVVEAVGEFDGILYEVSNEEHASTQNSAWQDWVLDTLRELETAAGCAVHPRLRSVAWPTPATLDDLYASPAEAISPNDPSRHGIGLASYAYDPPPGDGRKVILIDTDHIWGVGGDAAWVWKSVTRGLNPLLMDPWESDFVVTGPFDQRARDALGVAVSLSRVVDLATLEPRGDLGAGGCVLGSADGSSIVVYAERDDAFTVDLRHVPGASHLTWIHPVSGLQQDAGVVDGGAFVLLHPPFAPGSGAVAVLRPA